MSTLAINDLYKDTTKLFDDNAIAKKELEFSEPLLAMVLVPNNSMFVVPTDSKILCKISLPSTDDKVSNLFICSILFYYTFFSDYSSVFF